MLLFLDGFDKYGPLNTSSGNVASLLTAGEWTSSTGTTLSIAAGLSATGFAVQLLGSSTLTKTLPASYSRLVGGFRINTALTSGFNFLDAGAYQASLQFTSTGQIQLRNGRWDTGTVIATSAASISANSTHSVEFDITFGNASPYQVWLDGVSILSGTGDITATANNSANAIQLGAGAITFDDLYLFDTTGPNNNAVLLTSPRIETQFASADAVVQFSPGAATLGVTGPRVSSLFNSAANFFYLRPFTPAVACTLNSISFLSGSGASPTINFRPVVYAETAGVPVALLASGSTVTGVAANTVVTMPLSSSQTLVAGTRYWLGLMADVALTGGGFALTDNLFTSGKSATVTFSSGAPSTAPGMSVGSSLVVFGNISGTGFNWYEVAQNPAQGNLSYVFDATVGHEDLYNFPAVSGPASAIYAVAVKANVSKSDAGARTVSVRLKSNTTDSPGSVTSFGPATSYGWLDTFYPTDPNTGAAWTLAAINAAQAGLKVET